MSIHSFIMQPLIKKELLTFRNLITWDKGQARGMLSPLMRSYANAAEYILFYMKGVQGFNTNSDNYYEGWEPIRLYLLKSRLEMGWDVPTMKKIAGHSDKSRDHWTSKSQWNLPTKEVYTSFQKEVARREKEENKQYNAFKKKYTAFKREYNEIKKEYNKIKKEYYNKRAYFNNTHANMTNVWHFHPNYAPQDTPLIMHGTPKPINIINRIIRSSSKPGSLILSPFIGSGTDIISAELCGRTCYGIEIKPENIKNTIKRYEAQTGNKAKKI